MNAPGSLVLALLLAGCTHTVYLDKPRTVTVSVPVTKPIPPEFVADCAPAPLAGPSVGAALDRLASVEGCLDQLRERLERLRAIH